jgi:plasmid stability protein
MAHLVLNDVDPKIIEALSHRADPHGRSIED